MKVEEREAFEGRSAGQVQKRQSARGSGSGGGLALKEKTDLCLETRVVFEKENIDFPHPSFLPGHAKMTPCAPGRWLLLLRSESSGFTSVLEAAGSLLPR